MATRRAMLVGIDKYADRSINELHGCVNDAVGWAELLTRDYGFDERNVVLLRNEQATKQRYLRALSELIGATAPGDMLVVHTSAHGTQVRDDESDERDAMDEVLVVYDHSWSHTLLLDDELSAELARVQRGAQLTCIFDTCHSGTMLDTSAAAYRTRGGGGGGGGGGEMPEGAVGRYIEAPKGFRLKRSSGKGAPGFGAAAATGAWGLGGARGEAGAGWGKGRKKPGGVTPAEAALLPGIAISGATDDQTAADAPFGGTPFGAFSYSFMATLREGPDEQPWQQAHREVLRRLRAKGFSQTPLIEGPPGFEQTPVLGGRGARRAAAQVPADVGLAAGGDRSLAVPLTPVDLALAEFRAEDYTVRLCDALFSVVPYAGPVVRYGDVEQAVKALYPQGSAAVVDRARAVSSGEGAKAALWVANALDVGDAGIAVFSGLKGAFNLFFGDKKSALETDPQQGLDAAMKLLGIGYAIAKLYPGPIAERVQMFYATPAGKHIIVYYSLIEVALPFLDNAMAGAGSFVSQILGRYGGEAAQKLSASLGAEGAAEAQGVVQQMLGWVEGALSSVLPYANAAAEKARPYLPTAMTVADQVAGVVATGADALPVYRYLGARLVAESAVLIASRG